MNGKKLALLIGAVLIALVASIIARDMFVGSTIAVQQANQAQKPAIETQQIMIATRELPVGTIIDPASIKYQAWPKDLEKKYYFVQGEEGGNVEDLAGTVVRYPITAGEPITRGALVSPSDRGFLAAALGPGMRAITVPVTAISGVGGFIFPGDRVDLILTQEVSGGGDGPPLKVSETIIKNMRVLATDKKTSNKDKDGNKVVEETANVTLEATPKLTEKVTVAQTLGQLSLSLRSIADTTDDLEVAIAKGEIKLPEGVTREERSSILIKLATQPIDAKPTFTVGGEVSRFQRKTIPSKPRGDAPAPVSGPMPDFGSNSSVFGSPLKTRSFPSEPVGSQVKINRTSGGTAATSVPVGAQ